MISILELWLPILLSAVLAFLASFVIHQLLNWHAGDFSRVPAEENLREAVRKEGLQPGSYFFPFAGSTAEMKSAEMVAKYKQGPNGFLIVRPTGVPGMGSALALWFLFCLLAGVLAAYVTGRTLGASADYLQVFRVSGTTAFLVYAGSLPIESIWFGRKWSTTFKHAIDGLIYALLTAGCFGWLWPS